MRSTIDLPEASMTKDVSEATFVGTYWKNIFNFFNLNGI